MEDPIAAGAILAKTERKWLLQAEELLRPDDDDLRDILSASQLQRARAAYRLLVIPPT